MSDPPGFEWLERGAGAPVLFVPGSYSTARAWAPVWAALPEGLRLISTAILGCGATPESRGPNDFHMDHQVDHVVRAVRQVGAPCHLAGHSFGGTVALAAVCAGAVRPLSLTLFEANPIGLLAKNHPLRRHCVQVAAEFARRLDGGDPDAPQTIIDFYGGPGTWTAFPAAVRAYCLQVAPANRLDWHTVMTFDPGRAALECPARVIRGARTNPLIRELSRRLATLLDDGREHVVAGAGHFLIASHPAECAVQLRACIDRAEAK